MTLLKQATAPAACHHNGFPVIWVNRGQAPLDRLGLTPDLEVRDLEELARALGR